MVFLGIIVAVTAVFASAQMMRMYRLSQELKNGGNANL